MGAKHAWYLRTGLSTRAAGVTERYYAFGPAPGGYQVGDPSLSPEKNWESELGFTASGDHLTAGVSVFYSQVTDYIQSTVIARQDFNGDGNEDMIKGFENVDATLTGGELGCEWRVRDGLYLPATLSYVRGRNTTGDRDLPEIPPLFGTAEARWRAHADTRSWLWFGAYFAADQDKIDPEFGEDRTGGYTTWNIGLESAPVEGLALRLWVSNLFDRLYHDHLTREAMLATGGMMPGQEIPAPGRSFNVTARMEF
jgi:iron complex outermembrane receptor protein